jgi:hypothetical protein
MSDDKKTEVKRFTIKGRSGSWAPMGYGTGLIKLLFDDGECVIAEMHEDTAKETK